MVIIRRCTFFTKNTVNDTLSLLCLDVEKAHILTNAMGGDTTVDTNKPWVGKIETATGTFEIIQTNPYLLPLRYFEGNFFALIIQGKIVDDGLKTKIEIAFSLRWRSFITLIAVYLFPIVLMVAFVDGKKWEHVSGLIGWCLAFTIPATLFLLYQLHWTEKEMKRLLGVHVSVKANKER